MSRSMRFAVAALVLAVLAAVFLIFAPLGETVRPGLPGEPLEVIDRSSLVRSEGMWVLWLFTVPIAVLLTISAVIRDRTSQPAPT